VGGEYHGCHVWPADVFKPAPATRRRFDHQHAHAFRDSHAGATYLRRVSNGGDVGQRVAARGEQVGVFAGFARDSVVDHAADDRPVARAGHGRIVCIDPHVSRSQRDDPVRSDTRVLTRRSIPRSRDRHHTALERADDGARGTVASKEATPTMQPPDLTSAPLGLFSTTFPHEHEAVDDPVRVSQVFGTRSAAAPPVDRSGRIPRLTLAELGVVLREERVALVLTRGDCRYCAAYLDGLAALRAGGGLAWLPVYEVAADAPGTLAITRAYPWTAEINALPWTVLFYHGLRVDGFSTSRASALLARIERLYSTNIFRVD
jgi:hypothetical protein